MIGKYSATYGVWSAVKVQLTVYSYICKNSIAKNIFL